jgi:Flp pilus assembly protein TadD
MKRLLILPPLLLLAGCETLEQLKITPAQESSAPPSEQKQDRMQLAADMKAKGNYAGAAEIYREIAATSEEPLPAQLELAAANRKLGKTSDAIAILQQAEKKHPQDEALLMQLGYALIDANQPEEAVQLFDRLIALNPSNGMAYNGKGVAFDNAGNHLAAQELYQLALKHSPDAPSIQNNLAMSLILNNQVDQAIPLLESLKSQPGSGKTVRQNLALAYGLKGEKDKALALNLQDLSREQAQENMRFYEEYARMQKERAAAAPSVQIGFADAATMAHGALAKDAKLAPAAQAAEPLKKKKKKKPAAKPDESAVLPVMPAPIPAAAEKPVAPPPAEPAPAAVAVEPAPATPAETKPEEKEAPLPAAPAKKPIIEEIPAPPVVKKPIIDEAPAAPVVPVAPPSSPIEQLKPLLETAPPVPDVPAAAAPAATPAEEPPPIPDVPADPLPEPKDTASDPAGGEVQLYRLPD